MQVTVKTKPYRRIPGPTGRKVKGDGVTPVDLNRNEIYEAMRDGNVYADDNTLVEKHMVDDLLAAEEASEEVAGDDGSDESDEQTDTTGSDESSGGESETGDSEPTA